TPSQPASAGTTQPANTSQSQTAMQSAPTTQSGNATATSVQGAPANGDVTVSVDGAATDPGGSGRQGMLIQIWIPLDGGTSPAANRSLRWGQPAGGSRPDADHSAECPDHAGRDRRGDLRPERSSEPGGRGLSSADEHLLGKGRGRQLESDNADRPADPGRWRSG